MRMTVTNNKMATFRAQPYKDNVSDNMATFGAQPYKDNDDSEEEELASLINETREGDNAAQKAPKPSWRKVWLLMLLIGVALILLGTMATTGGSSKESKQQHLSGSTSTPKENHDDSETLANSKDQQGTTDTSPSTSTKDQQGTPGTSPSTSTKGDESAKDDVDSAGNEDKSSKETSTTSSKEKEVETTQDDDESSQVETAQDDDEPSLEKPPQPSEQEDEEDQTDEGGVETQQQETFPNLAPGFKRPERQLSPVYVPRHKPITAETKTDLAGKYGQWTHVDSKASQRPKQDYFASYPNRDIPREEFPPDAWQTDTDYLSSFLPQGIALAERAMEAILAEYGHGKSDEPDKDFDERSAMFRLNMYNLTEANPWTANYYSDGGWTTQDSYDGLVRRILHAIMTEDTFTFVMGGHSAAAAHGNHFQQSYTLQLQRVMEPIFDRLGVLFESHNFGMGGLGTTMNAMAASTIYGKDIDILMWDSGMTEKGEHYFDLFARQGLFGNRVPVLWARHRAHLRLLNQKADVDVGEIGSGMSGLPQTLDAVQALDLPWAARYIAHPKEQSGLARTYKYNATCWFPREDVTPPKKQKPKPGSQVSWHPGFREHQIQGRTLAFAVLRAIRSALTMWNDAEGYVLPDEAWHMTAYYENIRNKLSSFDESKIPCLKLPLPNAFCLYRVQGRTEFTPRANPAETSIRTILKPGSFDYIKAKPNFYDPPDVRMFNLEAPDGAVDVLNIIENGYDFTETQARRKAVELRMSTSNRERQVRQLPSQTGIKPGLGWQLNSLTAPDNCDGTLDSFCGRSAGSDCLLYDHNDHRGGLLHTSFSGWLVMNLNDLKHGVIVIKIEDWHFGRENSVTQGWKCENNECDDDEGGRHLRKTVTSSVESPTDEQQMDSRILGKAPPVCDDFRFEFAIDGKVTSLSKTEFTEKRKIVAHAVHMWTLLDDPDFIQGESKDVEVAIRILGCGLTMAHLLTHVYWI